jgi:hypothetical protein
MLASLLYPYDDDAPSLIDGWLEELEREGCIQRYQVADAKYIAVINWRDHQKIDRPSRSRFPEPPRIIASPREPSTQTREPSSGDQGPRIKDQGREGIEEGIEDQRASARESEDESEPSQEPNGDVPEPEAKLEEPVLSGPVPDEGKSSLATERKRDLAESAPSYAISGNAPRLPARVADDDWPEDADPRDVAMRTLLAAHPRPVFGHHATMVAIEQVKALAAERGKGEYEAYAFLLGRVKAYKTATDGWQPSQKNFIVSAVNFFNDEVYRQDDDIWKRNDHDGAGDGGDLFERLAKGPRGLGTDVSTLPRYGSPEHRKIQEAARTRSAGARPGFVGPRLH